MCPSILGDSACQSSPSSRRQGVLFRKRSRMMRELLSVLVSSMKLFAVIPPRLWCLLPSCCPVLACLLGCRIDDMQPRVILVATTAESTVQCATSALLMWPFWYLTLSRLIRMVRERASQLHIQQGRKTASSREVGLLKLIALAS